MADAVYRLINRGIVQLVGKEHHPWNGRTYGVYGIRGEAA